MLNSSRSMCWLKWNAATELQRYAATGGIPDALLSCHRYDEILPPGGLPVIRPRSALELPPRATLLQARLWYMRFYEMLISCGEAGCLRTTSFKNLLRL